ncbi:MAG: hypothetical protein AAF393_11545 [Pseudomonadota bacterium]
MKNLFLSAIVLLAPTLAWGQDAGVSIELNKLGPADNGCTLTFVVRNSQEADIERAVWEAVLFDAQGQVDRLTLFDFSNLPAKRARVRQFVVPDLQCDTLGQVLFNGLHACKAPDGIACDAGLKLSTRTKTEISG